MGVAIRHRLRELGKQNWAGISAPPVLCEKSEPGPRTGHDGRRPLLIHDLVFAVTEENEVVVAKPVKKSHRLIDVPFGERASILACISDHGSDRVLHGIEVGDNVAHVAEHTRQGPGKGTGLFLVEVCLELIMLKRLSVLGVPAPDHVHQSTRLVTDGSEDWMEVASDRVFPLGQEAEH